MPGDWMLFVLGMTENDKNLKRNQMTNIIQGCHRLAGGGVREEASAEQGCAASLDQVFGSVKQHLTCKPWVPVAAAVVQVITDG